MADDTPTQSGPAGSSQSRIQAMLKDLAAQQSGAQMPPQNQSRPAPVPQNLPVKPPGGPAAPQPQIQPPPVRQPVPPAPKPVSAPQAPPLPKQPAASATPPAIKPPPAVAPPPRPAAPPPPPTVSAPSAAAPVKPPPTPPKSAPPPTEPAVQAPGKRPPESAEGKVTSEVRTMNADIERLRVGQTPVPVPASQKSAQSAGKGAPAAPPVPPPPPPDGVTIPDESTGGGMGRKIIIGLVILVTVGLLVVLASSFLGSEPEATPTPTASLAPTPTATLRPSSRDLSSYFGLATGTVDASQGYGTESFYTSLDTNNPGAKLAKRVDIRGPAGGTLPPLWNLFGFDVQLGDPLGSDVAYLVFGQDELFDTAGTIRTGLEARLILVFELTDATAANQRMADTEKTALGGIDDLFRFNYSSSLAETFSDAAYRQIPVRYRNFPYADRSVDWAIVPASNGTNYLVITGSRQSMFFAIDQLLK